MKIKKLSTILKQNYENLSFNDLILKK